MELSTQFQISCECSAFMKALMQHDAGSVAAFHYYYYYYHYCYYYCCYYYHYYDHYQHDAGSVAAFRQGRQVTSGSGPMAAQGGGMRQQQQLSNSRAVVRHAGTAGSTAAVPPTELPYHRFKAGESILISSSKGQEVRS